MHSKGGLEVQIIRSDTEACMVDKLIINQKEANIFEFGTMMDLNPEIAPPCGCGNRQFVPKSDMCSNAILNRYNITKEQAEKLKEILEKELNFGFCRRCK